ncbi:MAG TPA: hypothetical protein DET40_10125 [Lentisphaeria bacterium]|nr:MAG: hypothetical protein A2X45_21765 [Lentisphaerae bacterium GWF2_50_93]HCE43892.1 hypothetical protein [Lentisphaeria bacterium]
MAANKYIAWVAGSLSEVVATVTSTGVSMANKIVALDATGKLDSSLMPTGISAEVKVLVASEALSARNLVNIWNDTGTEKARKADASNGRRANGFVLEAVNQGANATVYLEGTITGLSSKTPGAPQYLSADAAGTMVETPDATAGEISQEVGVAVSATEVSFEPQQPVTIA